MPDYTTNYALIKPKKSENYDIDDVTRKNMDTIDTQLANKVDKILGKGLSSCDFTEQYKTKLDRLNNYDDTDIKNSISNLKNKQKEQDTTIDDINNDINLANRNLANVIQLAMTNQKNIDTEHETNTQQDKDIANLKTENEELKAENERLNQDLNALPSNTASGEYITLNDSADSRFNKFKVLGKSTQKTRSGKNMLKVLKPTTTTNGITFTNNGDGSITINGTASGTAYYNINNDTDINRNFFTLEKNQYYGLYLGNTNEGLNFAVRTRTTNERILETGLNNRQNIQQYTGETDDECYAFISIVSGTTINNLIVYPMIVKGTEIGEWELYGALPRPNEESPIQNVEGNVNIAITNSNLFGKGFATPKTDTNFWHTVGEGFTPLEDGWGRLKLDNTGSSSAGYMNAWSRMSNFLNVIKPSTKYKIIVEWRNLEIGTNISSNYLCICGNNNQEAFQAVVNLYYSTLTTTNKATFTVTTKDNIKPLPFLLRTFISVRAGERLSLEVRISIQSVDTNADYEDGQNQQYVFPLQEGQKLFEGSYLTNDGIHHNIKQRKMVLSEFNISVPYEDEGICSLMNKSGFSWDYININGMCSHFKNAKNTNIVDNFSAKTYLNDNEFNFRNASNGKDRLYFKNSAFTTLEQWQDFFNNNDVIVEYECEEYVEAYTDEQKQVYDEIVKTAKTYKTVTNIFSTNEVSPKFEIEYRQDIKSLITQQNQLFLEGGN